MTFIDSPSAHHYRSDLERARVLSFERQSELATRYQTSGDRSALNALVRSNMRLVVSIAKEHARGPCDLDELIGWGNLGLVEAVPKFDPRRGIPFPTYAAYWIRARILGAVHLARHVVHLGSRAARKLMWRLVPTRRALEAEGSPVTAETIAARLSLDPADVAELLPFFESRPISLDQPVFDDDETTFVDRASAPWHGETIGEHIDRARVTRHLAGFRESLGERDRTIWDRRVMSEQPEKLSSLGERFGLSKERVRQLEAALWSRALAALRDRLRVVSSAQLA